MYYKICLCVKYSNNGKIFHMNSLDNEKEIFSNMFSAWDILEEGIF